MNKLRSDIFWMSELSQKTKVFIFLLPFVLVFTFGIFGSDYSDQGFVRGFTWRIMSGEIPYSDFIYPRPVMTILLDFLSRTLSPSFLEVFIERLRFYYQMLFVVLIVFSKAEYIHKSHRVPLILISYLLSMDCFPATSWYTVDGIFFGAISFYFFSNEAKSFVWCLFFACCSALTKQSFYPLPLILIVYSVFYFRLKSVKIIVLGLMPLFLFGGYLFVFGNYQSFLAQSSGATKVDDLIEAGFFAYFKVNTFKYVGFLLVGFYLFRKKQVYGWIFLSIVLGFDYFKFIIYNLTIDRTVPIKDWPRVLLVINTAFLLYKFKSPFFYRLTYLSSIAWCSSLSWGFQAPTLFLPGLVIVFYLVVNEFCPLILTRKVVNICLFFAVILYVAQNLKRYRQGMIWENTYHLGRLNPKYNLIFTNQKTFEIYSQLKSFEAQYPRSMFLPAFSDASYFLGAQSRLQLDWASDIEIRGEASRVMQKLQSCESIIFLYTPDYNEEAYSIMSSFFKTQPFTEVGKFQKYCL